MSATQSKNKEVESKGAKDRTKRRLCIARRLREAREATDLTQANVARLFDPPLSRAAIGQWEVGDTLPDVDRLAILSKAFGATIDALVFGEDSPHYGTSKQPPLTAEALRLARNWMSLPRKAREQIAALVLSMKR